MAGGEMADIWRSSTFSVFKENFAEIVGNKTIIFVALAMITAWQVPARIGGKKRASNQVING
ncbi:hypothetical protein [Paenibacillus shirakamiensis]|uniref:hypothetical protein n=1 Tax=Paenibacillus shirakamiensis TaxID=1265935 RepID=UPI001AE9FAF9|nr:hypothetical protein [Paenibacillus shirakamiensis]